MKGEIIERPEGIDFSGQVTFEEWQKKGEQFSQMVNIWTNHIRWWIGDWLVYGEQMFPDRYTQACEQSLYHVDSLRNAAWVCRNVPKDNRVLRLSFEHHAQVAKLDSESQRYWLEEALANALTVRELRSSIKAGKVVKKGDLTTGEKRESSLQEGGVSDDANHEEPGNVMGSHAPGSRFEEWWAANEDTLSGMELFRACQSAYTAGAESAK